MGIGRTNTGGGIKLHVVGGTTRPGSAAENTIWLNTGTAIPKWGIQNDVPGSPAAGEVYITTRNVTDNVLNVSSPNAVKVYLGTARQYVNGAWADLTGEVYYSGSWHGLQTFIYYYGTYNPTIGGTPWVMWANSGTSTVTNYSDRFTVFPIGGGATTFYRPKNLIDLTEIKTVKIVFTCSNMRQAQKYRFVATNNISVGGVWEYPAAGTAASETNYGAKTTITFSVESLSGNYYIGPAFQGYPGDSNLSVFSIELIT